MRLEAEHDVARASSARALSAAAAWRGVGCCARRSRGRPAAGDAGPQRRGAHLLP